MVLDVRDPMFHLFEPRIENPGVIPLSVFPIIVNLIPNSFRSALFRLLFPSDPLFFAIVTSVLSPSEVIPKPSTRLKIPYPSSSV